MVNYCSVSEVAHVRDTGIPLLVRVVQDLVAGLQW